VEKKGYAIEKELNNILSMKLFAGSGPGTANSVVSVTATGTASQNLQTGKKDDITEAIDSLKVVKNQIAATSKDASNED